MIVNGQSVHATAWSELSISAEPTGKPQIMTGTDLPRFIPGVRGGSDLGPTVVGHKCESPSSSRVANRSVTVGRSYGSHGCRGYSNRSVKITGAGRAAMRGRGIGNGGPECGE